MSKFTIRMREEGRGKATVKRFATLEAASAFIQEYWQGAEYVDGAASFHTDYTTFALTGFSLTDIGSFYNDDGCRGYRFHAATPATEPARCDCDEPHCSKCGCHTVGGLLFAGFCGGCAMAEHDQDHAAAQAWFRHEEARLAGKPVYPF